MFPFKEIFEEEDFGFKYYFDKEANTLANR